MNSEASVENAWRMLDQANGWLRFADAKATAVLSVSGVLGGVVVARYPSWSAMGQRPWPGVLASLALLAVATAGVFALRALWPRTWTRSSASLLHFQHVARAYADRPADFVRNCAETVAQDSRLATEIYQQLWVNSVLAEQKYARVNRALMALLAGLVLTVTTAVIGA